MSKLTDEELSQVAWTCRQFEIDECTPPRLQDFIAGRLAGCNPWLSLKVRRLSRDEMHELCERIKSSATS